MWVYYRAYHYRSILNLRSLKKSSQPVYYCHDCLRPFLNEIKNVWRGNLIIQITKIWSLKNNLPKFNHASKAAKNMNNPRRKIQIQYRQSIFQLYCGYLNFLLKIQLPDLSLKSFIALNTIRAMPVELGVPKQLLIQELSGPSAWAGSYSVVQVMSNLVH